MRPFVRTFRHAVVQVSFGTLVKQCKCCYSIIFLLSLMPYFLPDSFTPALWKGGPEDGLIAQIKEAAAPPQAFDQDGNFEDIGF